MQRSWMGCFLLTAIVFLLQLFPYTGIFLMMLAAPLWSVLLINLGFLLMIRDGFRDAQRRWLLIFPLLWFAGYAVAAALSHWQVHRFNAELEAANAGKIFPFDPATWDVVVVSARSEDRSVEPLTPQILINSFGLVRAYSDSGTGAEGMRGYVLSGSTCPEMSGGGIKNGRAWSRLHRGGYGTRMGLESAQNLCLWSRPEVPEKPIISIRTHAPVTTKGLLVNLTSQDVIIAPARHKEILLRAGRGSALSWLPQPVMGCWLDSGAPAWRCDAGFRREKTYDPNVDRVPNGVQDVVARALGIARASIEDRYPGAIWR